MASYIETTLTKGENIRYSAKVSVFILIPSFLIGLVFMLFFAPLGLIVWAIGLMHFVIVFFTTELGITNKRLIAKFGAIRRETVELNLSKIESVQVKQGIVGRVLNYGDIIISGTGSTKAPIPHISDPIAFRKAFSDLNDQATSSHNSDIAKGVAENLTRSREQSAVRPEPSQIGDTLFCTECGARNTVIASFCSECGHRIEHAT